MKKAILAAAVALATTAASAQNIELYGKMRVYADRDEVGTAAAVNKLTNDLSRFGIRGSENLGNGLRAFFTLETAVAVDAPGATTLGDRAAVVGLGNALGSVAAGRDKHSVARVLDNFDAMGHAYGTFAPVIHASHGNRLNNGAYVSVTPVKGISAHYQHGLNEVAGGKATQGFGADVAFGPLSASAARYDDGINNVTNIVGGKFAVKATGTTLFGIFSDDLVAGVERTGKSVGLQQKLGAPLTAIATYGERDSVKAYAFGAEYALSKRTFLHAKYLNQDAVLASGDRKQIGFGVEHNF